MNEIIQILGLVALGFVCLSYAGLTVFCSIMIFSKDGIGMLVCALVALFGLVISGSALLELVPSFLS